jgi:methionyl-tRNA formyltransferase
MKILWVSANLLGLELLREAHSEIRDSLTILTLSKDSTTVMYDNVPADSWDDFGVEVVRVEKISESIQKIKEINPDLVIMCGWRQKITKELLEIPDKGWVGFHPTLLPKGRGPAPIINSILSGWEKSGLTMFYLSEGIDNGDIIGQESFEIDFDDHASEVYDKVIKSGKILIRKYIPLLIKNNAPRERQIEDDATFFNKPRLRDNLIDLDFETPDKIYKKIKAFSKPYNGAFVRIGKEKIIIWRGQLEISQGVR